MKKNNKRESIIIAVILLVVLAVAFYLDAKLPSYPHQRWYASHRQRE